LGVFLFENGEILREFLKSNGIEFTKIAAQLNVTRQTIDRWLTNNENLEQIYNAAARPFLDYLKQNIPISVNDPLVEYQARKIMELEKENEELKKKVEVLGVNLEKDIPDSEKKRMDRSMGK
jgi:transcriptional regulator with XRE-family HTH domain